MSTLTHRRRKGVTLVELLLLMLILIGAAVGLALGITIGRTHGIAGMVIGAILGIICGVAAVLAISIVALVILEPFRRFWRWWRPYPPVCENGTCLGHDGFETYILPEDVVLRLNGLSWLGWKCRCGSIYAGGYDLPFRNRWVRVLPNGKIRPYLVHHFLGRWQSDDGSGLSKQMLE